ncbi:MAG: Ig-like domain-containing protein [Ignavibacteriales bacterium]|nr:Ig-like domain-containing protein [Ignavibacteriales bacterium]
MTGTDVGSLTGTTGNIATVVGGANAAQSTLTPTSASIAGNGSSTQTLTVTAKDVNGNPLVTGGATVTITKSSGTGTVGAVVDNGNGTYSAIVTSPVLPGSGVFVATLGGNPVQGGTGSQTSATLTYTLSAGSANAARSTLTPTSASITANGTSTQVLTVTAIDVNGNPVGAGGATVTITKLSGAGTISSPVVDNGNGTYTATVTSPSLVGTGSGVFVATLGGNPVQSNSGSQTQATVTYTVGAISAVGSTLTPTAASITANGTSTTVLTVTAKDATGNNIGTGGAIVTITKQSGVGTIGAVTDNGNGTYTATITSTTTAGNGVFVATLGGSPVQSGTGSQTQSTITCTPGAADATVSTLTPTSTSITADGSSTQNLIVTVKDANGNNVGTGGATVVITQLSGTGSIGSVSDNGDGTYRATVTSPTLVGNGIFVATVGGNPVKNSGGSQTQATVTYVAGAVNAAASTLTPTSASIVADGSSTQVLTVTAKDVHGNNIGTGGATVVIAQSSGTGTIGAVTDHGDGTYTATVTSPSSAGSGVFAATLGGSAVKSGTGSQTAATITYTTPTTRGVSVSPVTLSGSKEAEVEHLYRFDIQNTGNLSDIIELSYSSTQSWVWTFYNDANNNGAIDGEEALLTDHDADGKVDTDVLAASGVMHVLARTVYPNDPANHTTDVTTVTVKSGADASKTMNTVITTTINYPSIVLTRSVSSPTAVPGTELTYTISYHNAGLGRAFNFQVVDGEPDNTLYVPGSVTLGGVSKTDAADSDEVTVTTVSGKKVITVRLTPPLAPSETGTVTFKAVVQ